MSEPAEDGDRRLTPKGRATRDRIVAAAAELMVGQGLAALNMDTLRKLASVSGSQLSHYFADKQALIRSVIDHQIDEVLDFHRQPRLGRLDSFEDFERWIDLNMRALRRIEFAGTPTYHGLVGQLAKTDEATRARLAAGYGQWVDLFETAIGAMRDSGVLVREAEPRRLALVMVGAHQAGGTMAFIYRETWPHADALRFAVNYLRMFATDPVERTPRPPRRPRRRRAAA